MIGTKKESAILGRVGWSFVKFEPDDQRSVVREITLSNFKSGDPQKVQEVLTLRRSKSQDSDVIPE